MFDNFGIEIIRLLEHPTSCFTKARPLKQLSSKINRCRAASGIILEASAVISTLRACISARLSGTLVASL